MWYDLFYNPFGLSLPFFVIGALVGGIRAKRRNGSCWSILLTSFGTGFITWTFFAVVVFVGIMVLWGMST